MKMNRIRNILACLGVALAASGCATGRIQDLQDCGRLSVGLGLGLDATAKVGCILHPSIGVASATTRIGHENRRVSTAWKEQQVVWPVSSIVTGQMFNWNGDSFQCNSVSYLREMKNKRRPERGGRSSRFHTFWIPAFGEEDWGDPFSFHELTDVEVGATALFVSARAGINPLEIVDFILGFVGFDIAKDDPKKKYKEKPTTESTPTK